MWLIFLLWAMKHGYFRVSCLYPIQVRRQHLNNTCRYISNTLTSCRILKIQNFCLGRIRFKKVIHITFQSFSFKKLSKLLVEHYRVIHGLKKLKNSFDIEWILSYRSKSLKFFIEGNVHWIEFKFFL